MKLRNKKTGKIIDLEFWGIFTDGDAIGFESEYEDENEYCYNSLAELNEEWEDYNPQEPLIKDENIRQLVRDWAKINAIDRVEYRIYNHPDSYRFEYNPCEDCIAIDFVGWIHELKKEGFYTIAELCGEEEC